MWRRSQNVKNEKCTARYFAFHTPFSLLAFCSISQQVRHLREKLEDFVVYFFAALIKHEIPLKCEKCIVCGVFRENIRKVHAKCEVRKVYSRSYAKYQRNAKYEKCIVGLIWASMRISWLREVLLFAARWRPKTHQWRRYLSYRNFLTTDTFPCRFSHHSHQILCSQIHSYGAI